MKKFLVLSSLVVLLTIPVFITTSAYAMMVNFTCTGNVDTAAVGNGFDLDVGDQITAYGTYDDSDVTGVGGEEVFFGAGTGNVLAIQAGTWIWTEKYDIGYLTGYPSLYFTNGGLVGVNYLGKILGGLEGEHDAILSSYQGFGMYSDIAGHAVSGVWDTTSFINTAPVPEPTSILLLSAGLVGLVGFRKKFKT